MKTFHIFSPLLTRRRGLLPRLRGKVFQLRPLLTDRLPCELLTWPALQGKKPYRQCLGCPWKYQLCTGVSKILWYCFEDGFDSSDNVLCVLLYLSLADPPGIAGEIKLRKSLFTKYFQMTRLWVLNLNCKLIRLPTPPPLGLRPHIPSPFFHAITYPTMIGYGLPPSLTPTLLLPCSASDSHSLLGIWLPQRAVVSRINSKR